MDNDSIVLDEAASAVTYIDIQYRLANFNEKKKLKKSRDAAFSTYSMTRLELLEEGVICTDEDVTAMQEIRREIEEAAETQTLIRAIPRFITFLIGI
ncbi:MAG: hypothetical protein AAFQ80_04690 [Cyanobacteria bacterium J06621_8]